MCIVVELLSEVDHPARMGPPEVRRVEVAEHRRQCGLVFPPGDSIGAVPVASIKRMA